MGIAHLTRRIRIWLHRVGSRIAGASTLRALTRVGSLLVWIAARDGDLRSASALSVNQIVEYVGRDAGSRSIVLQRIDEAVPLSVVLKSVDDQALVVPAVRLLASLPGDRASERSLELYEAIVLSTAERGPHSLAVALLLVQKIASAILTDHASAILKKCLDLADHPVDPYARPGAPLDARLAAAALIAKHPELDRPVGDRLANTDSRRLLPVVGAGLAGRRLGTPTAFARVLEAMNPDRELALHLGQLVDSRFSSSDPVHQRSTRAPRLRLVMRRLFLLQRRLVPWLLGPLLYIAVVLGVESSRWTSDVDIGFGPTVGLLGVLIAVQLLSSELAAQRLPGVIARRTSAPSALHLSYSLALTSLLAQAVLGSSGMLSTIESIGSEESTLLSLIVIAVLLAFSMRALLRRSDPAYAAERYASDHASLFERAGIAMGSVQVDSYRARALISSLSYARLDSSPSVRERRSILPASRSGLRGTRTGRLKRLANARRWKSNALTLVVLGFPGTTVTAGDELGSVVPVAGGEVRPADYRRARRTLRVVRSSRIDEAAEAAAALVEMVARRSASGDSVGARRISAALRAVTVSHLEGLRRARIGLSLDHMAEEGPQLPVVQTLRVAIESLIDNIVSASAPANVEVLAGTIKRLVRASKKDDYVAALVASHAARMLTKEEITATDILLVCGERALDLGEVDALAAVQQSLENALPEDSGSTRKYVLEAASQLAAAAVWNDYFRAQPVWQWYWSKTDSCADRVSMRLFGALRIGAAARLAGNYSVAIEVALALRDVAELGEVAALIDQRGGAAREQVISQMFGGYLGDDAEASLREYVRFVEVVQDAVV